LILSPQANTRIFPCPAGAITRQDFHGTVYAEGLLVAGGDPTVLYQGSRYLQSQHWVLHPGARLVVVDWMTAGRIGRGERFAFGQYRSDLRVENPEGRPLLVDRLCLEPGTGEMGMGGFASLLTVHVLGPGWAGIHDAMRDWLSGEKNREGDNGWIPRGNWRSQGLLAGLGVRAEVGFSLRALGRDRHALEPLMARLFRSLDSDWIGFNPWTRKY
jgi:urease accessory protein UreH